MGQSRHDGTVHSHGGTVWVWWDSPQVWQDGLGMTGQSRQRSPHAWRDSPQAWWDSPQAWQDSPQACLARHPSSTAPGLLLHQGSVRLTPVVPLPQPGASLHQMIPCLLLPCLSQEPPSIKWSPAFCCPASARSLPPSNDPLPSVALPQPGASLHQMIPCLLLPCLCQEPLCTHVSCSVYLIHSVSPSHLSQWTAHWSQQSDIFIRHTDCHASSNRCSQQTCSQWTGESHVSRSTRSNVGLSADGCMFCNVFLLLRKAHCCTFNFLIFYFILYTWCLSDVFQ